MDFNVHNPCCGDRDSISELRPTLLRASERVLGFTEHKTQAVLAPYCSKRLEHMALADNACRESQIVTVHSSKVTGQIPVKYGNAKAFRVNRRPLLVP